MAFSASSSSSDLSALSSGEDVTSFFGDDVLIRILQMVKDPMDLKKLSLVSKRWMRLLGLLKTKLTLHEWSFLESGRLAKRFPNLTDVDLSPAWTGVKFDATESHATVMMSCSNFTMRMGSDASSPFDWERNMEEQWPTPLSFDRGLYKLVCGCRELRSLCVVDVQRLGSTRSFDFSGIAVGGDMGRNGSKSAPATPLGLPGRVTEASLPVSKARRSSFQGLELVAKYCPGLQELEVRQCTDSTALTLAEFSNLQVLRMVGVSAGFYHGTFTDGGLEHLAMCSRRIMVLSLVGCDIGYKGLAAVGQNCPMLSVLVLGGKGLKSGWMKALQNYQSLQTLRLEGLKHMDKVPGSPDELIACPCLSQLELVLCDVRPPVGFMALLTVCEGIRQLTIRDCWGLEDEQFTCLANCRQLQSLTLEGCSLLTANGLEAVVVGCKDLRRLVVTYCKNVKDEDISAGLQEHMFALKELKWQPYTQKFFSKNLKEAGVGEKGRWFAIARQSQLPSMHA